VVSKGCKRRRLLLLEVEKGRQDRGNPLKRTNRQTVSSRINAPRRRRKASNLPPGPVGAGGGAAIQALGGMRRGVGAYSRSYRRQAHVACCTAHQRDSLLQERVAGRRVGHCRKGEWLRKGRSPEYSGGSGGVFRDKRRNEKGPMRLTGCKQGELNVLAWPFFGGLTFFVKAEPAPTSFP
jgi:hypothetical protein